VQKITSWLLSILILTVATSTTAAFAQSADDAQLQAVLKALGAAPLGDPTDIAVEVITKAKHSCPKVVNALRNPDGTISAVCSNNENYRIFSLNNTGIAMSCGVLREMLGIEGC